MSNFREVTPLLPQNGCPKNLKLLKYIFEARDLEISNK